MVILALVGGGLLLLAIAAVGFWILENADVIGPLVAGAGLITAIIGYIAGAGGLVIGLGIVALVAGGLLFLSEGF